MGKLVRIQGISKSTLWRSWKEVRRQLKKAPRRDVLDYLEYDIDPDVWINRLLRRLASGEYSPERPTRYTLAKSKGFDRIITVPAIPDLVLYRTIVDFLFQRARRRQSKHVYFCQSALSKVVDQARHSAIVQIANENVKDETEYSLTSRGAFLEWLKYDQYRKLLIFKRIHPYIVITDITNFFDSVLYGRIEDSLYGLSAPPRLITLLFFLLENLSLREAFTPVQRIGLPVDPCDCSRALAHMTLFPHDERMVVLVGEDAYVRWMDDQNIGVNSLANGLQVLGEVGDSLRRLHLTANSGKSRILSLAAAKKHFHFSANRNLDRISAMKHSTLQERRLLRKTISAAWKDAVTLEGEGEWEKVLKQFYRHSARARSKLLVGRAVKDVKECPSLADRVSDYLRYVCSSDDVLSHVEKLLSDPEQVYPDVNYQLIEGLLKLSPDTVVAKRLCDLGVGILNETLSFPGSGDAKSLAPILILRYGDKRNLRRLFSMLQRDAEKLPADVTRALCAVVGGCGASGFVAVQKTASRLLRNHLSEFVKLIARIKEFKTVPGRFKSRVALSSDSITGAKYMDMRSLLSARILALCENRTVQVWLKDTRKNILSSDISDFDRRLIKKLWTM
jgi:hypothetical protein